MTEAFIANAASYVTERTQHACAHTRDSIQGILTTPGSYLWFIETHLVM